MLSTMTGSIIGGAIAAVMGLLGALGVETWREHRRENATRRSILEELMAEIEENLKISSEFQPGLFEVNVWKSSFTKLSFLPVELRYVIRQAYIKVEKRNFYPDFEGISPTERIGSQEITNAFILCRDKLQTWMDSN